MTGRPRGEPMCSLAFSAKKGPEYKFQCKAALSYGLMVLPILIRHLGGGGAGPRLEGAGRDGLVVDRRPYLLLPLVVAALRVV